MLVARPLLRTLAAALTAIAKPIPAAQYCSTAVAAAPVDTVEELFTEAREIAAPASAKVPIRNIPTN